MRIQTKNNYLLVKSLPPKELTKSGIILPEGAEEDGTVQTSLATVFAVNKDSEYEVGQVVAFSKLVPDDWEVEINGKKERLWWVPEGDIKGIIKL